MSLNTILKVVGVISLIIIAIGTTIIALDTLELLPEKVEEEKKEVVYKKDIDKSGKVGEKIDFKSLMPNRNNPSSNDYESEYLKTDIKTEAYYPSLDSILKSIFG